MGHGQDLTDDSGAPCHDEASLADQNGGMQSLTWELPRERVQNWNVTVPPRGMPPAGVALLSRSSRRRVL